MGFKHTTLAFKSTVFVLLAFAIVLFVRIVWMEWSGEFTIAFLRTGRIWEIVFLFAIGAIIAIVFTKLLQLEFRAETKPRPRPRPVRGRR